MIEIWKDIEGYEGLYQVSNLGRVINVKSGRILKQTNHKSGYMRVHLCTYGKEKCFQVHRLVAIAFIPNPNKYPIINHKDEKPSNNRVDNLEWCTAKYNRNYGNCNQKQKEKQKNRPDISKRIAQYDFNNVLVAVYPSSEEIKRQLGFDGGFIRHCCMGNFKTAYGYIWKYLD